MTNRDYRARHLPHFDETKVVTGPYDSRKDKRLCVNVRDTKTNKSIQQLFSRYIVEQHLGRYLLTEENVDHRDRDKLNDNITNLRIVSRSENTRDDVPRAKLVEIICIQCGSSAFKSPNHIRHSSTQGKAGPFCSKSCCGLYGAQVQNGYKSKLPAQPKVASEYYHVEKEIGELIPINEAFALALEAALKAPLELTDAGRRRLNKERSVLEKATSLKDKKIVEKKERIFKKYEYWDSNYYGRSLHTNKEGRKFIYVVSNTNSNDKRHITYARFLMENLYGRKLDPHLETVDHIDNDSTNDTLDNLQVMTRKENAAKEQEHRKSLGLPMILPIKFKIKRI